MTEHTQMHVAGVRQGERELGNSGDAKPMVPPMRPLAMPVQSLVSVWRGWARALGEIVDRVVLQNAERGSGSRRS
ncbi:MAG: hypothetical protein JNK67_15620 [Alphaproteobacteria bacterium]|nr:hypothetical protein [Alphaproteobacteria bacterium]